MIHVMRCLDDQFSSSGYLREQGHGVVHRP